MIFDEFGEQLLKLAKQTEEEHKRKDREYQRKKRQREAIFRGIKLNPHQLRVHQKLQKAPGVLVYHGLGSGKTITSISAADALKLPAQAVVPAALRPNYRKEIDKVKPTTEVAVKSYEGFSKEPNIDNKILIFDEIQRLQAHQSRRTRAALGVSHKAAKRIGLSGTPIQNRPSDIAPIMNVIAGKRILPTGQDFDRRFVGVKVIKPGFFDRVFSKKKPIIKPTIKNRAAFAKAVRGLVDYHPSSTTHFPESTYTHVDVPMGKLQSQVYKHVTNRVNRSFWNRIERNLPLDKKHLNNLNAFMSAARQVSNTPAPYHVGLRPKEMLDHSPKMRRIISDIQTGLANNKRFKSVVYSNYIGAGVAPIAEGLRAMGVPHHVFTGGLRDDVRKQMVDDYNSGRVKVLLISGAGAEGLDLKGTRMVQIVEPHWNDSRIKQVIGRAIRYKSHIKLRKNERHVDVREYHSTLKNKTSADKYIKGLAKSKQELIDQFLDVLRREGSREA